MVSHLSNPWNNAVSYIEMLHNGARLARGSAFFWEFGGRTMLCTNWHNLSGRHPHTGQPLTPSLPDTVRVFGYKRVSEPDAQGFFELTYSAVDVTLCDSDGTGTKWYEHPALKSQVDIAVIDVTSDVSNFEIAHVNDLECDAVLDPFCSQDVFVLGFPFGQITGAPAPVWKRGTIALDPTFDPDGLPKFLIDTATREGMSGSVVLARHVLVGSGYTKKDGSQAGPVLYGQKTVVIGIYSGRHYPDLEKAQLGIVWKRTALEEAINSKCLATP